MSEPGELMSEHDRAVLDAVGDRWHACLKQLTRCRVVLPDGREFEATNSCRVGDVKECPRVTAGSPTGTGYELCGPPVHAEAATAALVPPGNEGGTAYLYGHTWLCGPCQWALTDRGIRTFIVTGEPA